MNSSSLKVADHPTWGNLFQPQDYASNELVNVVVAFQLTLLDWRILADQGYNLL